jgi:hypothetical protein
MGDGLLCNGSRILGKPLTLVALLPLMVHVMRLTTVLLPNAKMPPPWNRADSFSGAVSHFNGAMDCYVTVKSSSVGQ